VGDVRGAGLFAGVELVSDPEARTPDRAAARALVEGLRERGILTGTDGPDGNVVKIKPPMVVDESDADRAVDEVDALLAAGLSTP
jgi:4-aminobutyrate aminotransferase-like enzyme